MYVWIHQKMCLCVGLSSTKVAIQLAKAAENQREKLHQVRSNKRRLTLSTIWLLEGNPFLMVVMLTER